MFNLDDALNNWRAESLDAEPTLARSIDEMVEHLATQVEHQIEASVDPKDAFDDAVLRLGSASDLAAEFRQAQHPLRRAYDAVALDPSGQSRQRFIGVAHIITALCWAAAIIVFDQTEWLIVGFMSLTFMPLTVLSAKYSAMATKS